MAKPFAKKFYSGIAWQQCRDAYAKNKSYLCERCLAKGLYTPGEIVHHKIPLAPDNIHDFDVSLNWDNLELVCRECHAEEHGAKTKRYEVDEYGRVTAKI